MNYLSLTSILRRNPRRAVASSILSYSLLPSGPLWQAVSGLQIPPDGRYVTAQCAEPPDARNVICESRATVSFECWLILCWTYVWEVDMYNICSTILVVFLDVWTTKKSGFWNYDSSWLFVKGWMICSVPIEDLIRDKMTRNAVESESWILD